MKTHLFQCFKNKKVAKRLFFEFCKNENVSKCLFCIFSNLKTHLFHHFKCNKYEEAPRRLVEPFFVSVLFFQFIFFSFHYGGTKHSVSIRNESPRRIDKKCESVCLQELISGNKWNKTLRHNPGFRYVKRIIHTILVSEVGVEFLVGLRNISGIFSNFFEKFSQWV